MSAKSAGKGARGLAWHHSTCFLDMFPSVEIDKFPGWDSLEDSDRETLRGLIKQKTDSTKSIS